MTVSNADTAAVEAFLEGGDGGNPEAQKETTAAAKPEAVARVDVVDEMAAFLEGGAGPEKVEEDDGPEEAVEELDGEDDLEAKDDEDDEDSETDDKDEAKSEERKKGRARKQKERMKAAEAKVVEFEDIVPKVIENAEWFGKQYFEVAEQLDETQAENARLRAQLEAYSVPEYDSESDRQLAEMERENIKLRSEQEARESAHQQRLDAQRHEAVVRDAEEIRSLAPKVGLDELSLAKAVIARRAINPNESILEVAKDVANRRNRKKVATRARSQAAANGRAPRKVTKGGSSGVSTVGQYSNDADGWHDYLQDSSN